MQTVIRVAQFFVVFFLLVAAAGFLLPQQQRVERSIVIAAPAEEVFKQLDGAKAFQAWSPWASLDQDMKVSYFGPDFGPGSKMTWESNNPGVGSGSWVVVDSKENSQVRIALDFGGQGQAESWFKLQAVPGGTKVTWGFETDSGMNPIHRWFGLMLDKWVGGDYEKGLKQLKAKLELHSQQDLPPG